MMVLKSCVRLSSSGVERWSVRASHWLAVKIAQLLDTGLFFCKAAFLDTFCFSTTNHSTSGDLLSPQ